MVGRAVEIRQIVEKAQVGGLAVERVGALKLLVAVIIRRARSNVGGRPSRTSCRLIEIDNARQLDAMIANICRIDRQLSRKRMRSEEHTSELQSRGHLVCRLLLE